MKKIFLFLFLMIFTQVCLSQNQIVSSSIDKKLNRKIYSISNHNFNGFDLGLEVDSLTRRINYHNPISNQPLNNLVYLEGAKVVKISGYIHPDSLSFYRYTIVEDDSNLIVSDAIPKVKNPSSFQISFGEIEFNLGTYNIENKKITINYYKITNKTKVATIIIYNKKLAPAKLKRVSFENKIKGGTVIEMENKMELADFTFDSATKSMIIGIENVDLDFLYTATLKEKSTGKVLFSSNNWSYDFFVPRFPYMHIDKKYFEKYGDFVISIEPKLSFPRYVKPLPVTPFVYSFSVNFIDVKLYTKKELTTYIAYLIAFLGLVTGIIFIVTKRRNKSKLLAEQQQKQFVMLQLNSVRSQLNPHFLFNALAGIQNLMNKGEIDQANRYLSKFARLTRNVLDTNELVSLSKEKTLLDDYLQMEQLRFGFQYLINISSALDIENMEIPSMLLQPFVENAVKHGIAEKGNLGEIQIHFKKQEKDLVLSITDNGNGFDINKSYKGLGLGLSKNRITLLNSIYRDTPIILRIHSTNNGTIITIILTKWL